MSMDDRQHFPNDSHHVNPYPPSIYGWGHILVLGKIIRHYVGTWFLTGRFELQLEVCLLAAPQS